MDVNEQIWGAKADWVDFINNYAASVPVEERIQYASLDHSSVSTFENYILAGKIRVGTPIDQSLCYGALGDKMPLSNISNTAGAVGWREQEDGETPYRSYTANLQTSGNKDTRTVTNYIFGTWTTSSNINPEEGAQLYIRSAKRSDRFHQFWLPDSDMTHLIDWSSGDKSYNPTVLTKLLARIPVKNMIACPVVKCLSTVSTTGATASYVDLLNYINPQSNKNYTTHPYVITVGLVFYTAQNGVTEENINRNKQIRLNTCVITSPSNMMQNMPYYDYGGWDKNARYTGNAYHYGSCIGYHYLNSVECILPIMGLINAPRRTDTKFQDVNVKSDRDGNWDLFDVRFDLGTSEQATKGGGYALRMYSWAGKEPNIYTVEDSDPNHTDQQRYQNSTTYWAWNITADNVDEFREDVRKATAGFGLFFIEGGDNKNLALDDPDMFLGILEDGIGNGKYSHGEDNRNQDQWNWDDMHENDYDPNEEPEVPDIWSNNFPSQLLSYDHTLMNHWFAFADGDIYWAMRGINAVDLENVDEDATYGMNPIDGVLQARRVYFNYNLCVSEIAESGDVDFVVIGELIVPLAQTPPSSTHTGKLIKKNHMYSYDCGYKDVTEPREPYEMNDFRAYTPFSSAVFYDAFCGVVEIDPAKIMNKRLKVVQTVDFLTGDKITSLYSKNLSADDSQYVRIATLQGNCSEEIPINGLATSEYQRNKYMMSKQMIVTAIGMAGSALMGAAGATISATMGNPAGGSLQLAGSEMNIASTVVDLMMQKHVYDHTIPSAVKVSNGSANVESGIVFPPCIILYNPKMIEEYNESEYGLLTGFAGYKVDTLNNCGVGTHVVSHPKLDIPCTSSELFIIYDQLQKGIFVKEIQPPTP